MMNYSVSTPLLSWLDAPPTTPQPDYGSFFERSFSYSNDGVIMTILTMALTLVGMRTG